MSVYLPLPLIFAMACRIAALSTLRSHSRATSATVGGDFGAAEGCEEVGEPGVVAESRHGTVQHRPDRGQRQQHVLHPQHAPRRTHGPRTPDGSEAHLGDLAAPGVELIETVADGDDVRVAEIDVEPGPAMEAPGRLMRAKHGRS